MKRSSHILILASILSTSQGFVPFLSPIRFRQYGSLKSITDDDATTGTPAPPAKLSIEALMNEVDHVTDPPDLLPFLWSHSNWHPPTPLIPTDPTATTTKTTTKKKEPLTHTDNLKKRYRGDPLEVPPDVLEEYAKMGITYEAFDEFLEKELVVHTIGDVVKGVCMAYMHKSCLVEIGAKGSAILPMEEFAIELPPKPRIFDLIQPGDEVMVEIIDRDPWSGKWIVSKRSIELREHWERLEQLVLSKENIQAEVLSFNRGGYLCWCSGSPAFMPRSHMVSTESDMGIVGKTMTVQAIGINRERGYLTISRKMALAEATMAKYKWGDIVDAVVFKVLPYGVLVRFDGAQGLIHKSNLSHEDVPDIEKVLPAGTKIRCMIIRVLPNGQGISLSTKALEAEPGQLLRDPNTVFANAEITVPLYMKRKEEEQQVKSSATETMLEKLKNSLDSMVADNNAAAAAGTGAGTQGATSTTNNNTPQDLSFDRTSPLRSKLRTTPISMKDLDKRDDEEDGDDDGDDDKDEGESVDSILNSLQKSLDQLVAGQATTTSTSSTSSSTMKSSSKSATKSSEDDDDDDNNDLSMEEDEDDIIYGLDNNDDDDDDNDDNNDDDATTTKETNEEEEEDDLDQQAEQYERSVLFDGPEDHLENVISAIQLNKEEDEEDNDNDNDEKINNDNE